MTENIFDLTDVSDIPAEITVAYYRKFKEIKSKKQITIKVYNMARARNAKIRSIPNLKGVYELVK